MEGTITLPARRAEELIRTIADGVLEISTETEDVGDSRRFARISSGRSASRFNCEDAEDYPPVETADVSASVSPNILLDGIRRVLPTVAVEDSSPVLASTRMQKSGKRLCMAGVGGYRLSIYECSLDARLDPSDGDEMIELLIPRTSCRRARETAEVRLRACEDGRHSDTRGLQDWRCRSGQRRYQGFLPQLPRPNAD